MSILTTIRPNKEGSFPKLKDGIHDLALGNGTQFRIVISYPRGCHLYVGIVGKGCYNFRLPAHPGYVMDKLKLAPFKGDAANLCDFINDQLDWPAERARQGNYDVISCLTDFDEVRSLDDLFTITCGCGHEAPVSEWCATPILGDLPRGEYQCPKCSRAFMRENNNERYPYNKILLTPVSPQL